MKTFVTSDHHFKHENILEYAKRDFPDIETHDLALIEAWNSVVSEGDYVYHLGDFTLGNANNARLLFAQLNGRIFVLNTDWHHDKRWLGHGAYPTKTHNSVYTLSPIVLLHEEYPPVVLCHYPFEEWERKHYGAIHLHGHSHGNCRVIKNRLDVGVDVAYQLLSSYRPFELSEAVEIAKAHGE